MKELFLRLFLISFLFSYSYAWDLWWDANPHQLLYELKWDNSVQDTKLDNTAGWWIKDTLENIKWNSVWYIEWMGFIWLSIAFLLIIYNGIVILANFWWDDKLAKAKKRFVSLILWVVIVTSGYLIIKLVVSLIWQIF